jgi:two-component system alkaline phosphatase synthesis response regulator PhoP
MVDKGTATRKPEVEEILIIEDHLDMADILTRELTRHHYRAHVAPDGESGFAEAQRQPPSLIILDLMLPGMDGWEVCRLLKKDPKTKEIPLLILTALGDETDRVKGLELGADDYLSKPFSLNELMARLRALLRRKRINREPHPSGQLRVGPLVIDTERHEIRMAGQPLHLTQTEFGLLKFFAQHPGKVFRRDKLITAVWGEHRFVEEHNLDVHIHSIRRHLEPNPARPRFLITVRGIGYKFRTPGEEIGL